MSEPSARYQIKTESVRTLTLDFIRHRADESHRRLYTGALGTICISIPQAASEDVVTRLLRDGVQRTHHWESANHIQVDVYDCTYRDCLCSVGALETLTSWED
jgi:hypothetical protein